MSHNFKPVRQTIVALCLAALLGCKREPTDRDESTSNPMAETNSPAANEIATDEPAQPPDTVFFDNAGVSLNPGSLWQQLQAGSLTEAQSICLPVLEGIDQNRGSVVQVFIFSGSSDLESGIRKLLQEAESNQSVIKSSLKSEDFNSLKGIHGAHVSYDYNVFGQTHSNNLTAHVFLILNKKNDCVAINYVTLKNCDTRAVEEMIRDTLKLN